MTHHLPRIVSRFRWTAAAAAAVPRSSPSLSSRRWMTSTTNNKKPEASTCAKPTAEPEAPKKGSFLYRMAPPKGGTEPPDAKFLAIAAVVCSAGFYAWVIDPPKEHQE